MKKKNILTLISLFAAVCIAAGCDTETTTDTDTAATTEASASTEPEVDYVDDNGIVYYKNPSGITYEQIYQKLQINGVSFEAPLTLEKLGADFDIAEDSISYEDENNILCAFLYLNEEQVGVVYLDNSDNGKNNRYKEIVHINSNSTFLKDITAEFDISFGGISIGSPEEAIISELGAPYSISCNEDKTDALYAYTKDECLVHISCSDGLVESIYISTYLS